ncbi:unnamed protein product [Didymodactylos carnosus]|uniref:DUF642 domain-containing protein n=1 Tax=Didymodactylos carnosus TaxID=1234261 RepID=A0A8S2EQB7_9BILA|nr:unnamed protein product [Didymodactylos carnosus]CAF4088140.1 unnamed protein product [Didymodactylos carnosus]
MITANIVACTTSNATCLPFTIYQISNCAGSNVYEYFSCCWTPTAANSTIRFVFQHDTDEWCLDDVSVFNGTTDMLINGGFEMGSSAPGWVISAPPITVVNGASQAHSGNWYLDDWSTSTTDKITQTFTVVPGQNYNVSFYLYNGGTYNALGATCSIRVILST